MTYDRRDIPRAYFRLLALALALARERESKASSAVLANCRGGGARQTAKLHPGKGRLEKQNPMLLGRHSNCDGLFQNCMHALCFHDGVCGFIGAATGGGVGFFQLLSGKPPSARVSRHAPDGVHLGRLR